MKRMSSLAYHFGIKLRFYPSSKQKKIIKLNYDAQRFVYNSYVGRNRTNYHARRFLAINQGQAMPFAFPILNDYEAKLAETVVANDELLAKPKNIRDAYSFLRVKEIDSLALANAI
ncbi:helix-turn-helix domain-containing protein, partial [Lactobacillus helveticus]